MELREELDLTDKEWEIYFPQQLKLVATGCICPHTASLWSAQCWSRIGDDCQPLSQVTPYFKSQDLATLGLISARSDCLERSMGLLLRRGGILSCSLHPHHPLESLSWFSLIIC
jgi:hypothetical protein